MALRSGANLKIRIAPAVTDEALVDTLAELAALTYTQITNVQSIGQYGDAVNFITGATLEDAREQSAKGIRTAQDFPITVYPDPEDDGQLALQAAGESNALFPIMVENNDKVTGGGTNSKDYFLVYVSPRMRNPGDASTLQTDTYTCRINTQIFTAAAT